MSTTPETVACAHMMMGNVTSASCSRCGELSPASSPYGPATLTFGSKR